MNIEDLEWPEPSFGKVIGMRLMWTNADGTHDTMDIPIAPEGQEAGVVTIRWNAQGLFEIIS